MSGALTLTLGGLNPAAGNLLANQTNMTMAQFTVTAGPLEGHNVTQILVDDVSTGTLAGVVSNVRLYNDNGTVPGTYDGGDTQIGTAVTYNASRRATFNGGPNLFTLNAGASITLLVVQDFSSATTGHTYQVQLDTVVGNGQTSTNASSKPVNSSPLSSCDSGYASASCAAITSTCDWACSREMSDRMRPTICQLCDDLPPVSMYPSRMGSHMSAS